MTTVDPRAVGLMTSSPRPPRRPRRTLGATLRAYVVLAKLRIIELLLVTTVPTMILAAGGLPDLWLVLATLVGGTLAAASANTLNCYVDRDIDRLMNRTSRRPTATGEVSPGRHWSWGSRWAWSPSP